MTDINKLTPQERLELYLKRRKELQQKASREGWHATDKFYEAEQELWDSIIMGKKNVGE